jgi:hypothetical protein
MHQIWRLSEAGPQNLGLACTDDGLLLGRTSLIERRDGRFVVRACDEIERLLKGAYGGEPPVDRLMSGLARVASALNANDQCLARIAAVHLRMPDLASLAVRDAIAAEDRLIKYARDEAAALIGIQRCIRAPARRPTRAGSPRRAGLTIHHERSLLRTRIIRPTPTSRHRLMIGCTCHKAITSTNWPILSSGLPMRNRKTRKSSEPRSIAIITP